MAEQPSPDIIGLLSPLLGSVWQELRVLRDERKAGKNPFAANTEYLSSSFDETLTRLRKIDDNEKWWRQLLTYFKSKYVAPNLFMKPALRDWLADQGVAERLKDLAAAKLVGTSEYDAADLKSLIDSYGVATGEARRFAESAVDIAVAMLVAGALAKMSEGTRLATGITLARIDSLERQIPEVVADKIIASRLLDPVVIKAHNETARDVLCRILKRRVLAYVDPLKEVLELAKRIQDGDLASVSDDVRLIVHYWIARLKSVKEEFFEEANDHLYEVRTFDPSYDTRVVESWILAKNNQVQDALRAAREIESADGKSAVFAMMRTHLGDEAALQWFDEEYSLETGSFTGTGCYNIAIALIAVGRWEDAASFLSRVNDGHYDDCPDLHYVDGLVSASFLFPKDLRHLVPDMRIFERDVDLLEGENVDAFRSRGIRQFDAAASVWDALSESGRAQSARTWKIWLLLTDPAQREQSVSQIRDAMKDGVQAVEFAGLAYRFDVDYDPTTLRRFLRSRELTGGLTPQEWEAKVTVARHFCSPAELIEFLEKERDELNKVLVPGSQSYLLIRALAEDGQAARALDVLEENRKVIAESDFGRLQDLISVALGHDVRASLEQRYKETSAYEDLKNLVGYLRKARDWNALGPALSELFDREPNTENALGIVFCLGKSGKEEEIVNFVDDHPDLVTQSADLMSAKAWALFHLNQHRESKKINDNLLKCRDHANDRILDSELALQTGEWEKFPAIVEREKPHTGEREPNFLLHLASIAADSSPENAVELLEMAVERGSDDPNLLLAAHLIAVGMGKDSLAMGWFARARELSTEAGPVRSYSFEDLKEMIPAWSERSRETEAIFMRGDVPVHLATHMLNVSLSRILIIEARKNEDRSDPRHRSVVPIRYGARPLIRIGNETSIGLDITSLMLMTDLGILDLVIDAFEKTFISPNTMPVILLERRKAKFHQPSLVAEAKVLREYLNSGALKVLPRQTTTPSSLTAEASSELADLLNAAKELGGRVVRPLPVYAPGSYRLREADLGEHKALILSTVQLVDCLRAEGFLDEGVFDTARERLSGVDGEEPAGTAALGDGPLFLDELAVKYLIGADVFRRILQYRKDIYVHPDTVEQMNALISTEHESAVVEGKLDRLRLTLRNRIRDGRISFIRSRAVTAEQDFEEMAQEAPTLMDFFQSVEDCELVCIDDRFVGRHPYISDHNNQTVPLVGVVDVLLHLEASGYITAGERYRFLHLLRVRNFAIIPVELEELATMLGSSSVDSATGQLIETAELRAIRENVTSLKVQSFIQQSAETVVLDSLRLLCVRLIQRYWNDLSIPTEVARARGEWLYDNLMPLPFDWEYFDGEQSQEVDTRDATAALMSLLLVTFTTERERRLAYKSWLESSVVGPLLPLRCDVLERVADKVAERIIQLSEELAIDPE